MKDSEQQITAPDYGVGLIRHIVLFRYREDLSDSERSEVRRRFQALAESQREGRRYIIGLEWGPQSSPEGLDGGFQDGFIVTFGSEGDRNYYLGSPMVSSPQLRDPEHHRFKEFVQPFLATDGPSVLVFDFVTRG